MSILTERRGKKTYYMFQAGARNKIYLGPEGDLDPAKVEKAARYLRGKADHYVNLLYGLEALLPEEARRRLQETLPAGGTPQRMTRIRPTSLPASIDLDTLKTQLEITDISFGTDHVELRGRLPKDLLLKIKQERTDERQKRRKGS